MLQIDIYIKKIKIAKRMLYSWNNYKNLILKCTIQIDISSKTLKISLIKTIVKWNFLKKI